MTQPTFGISIQRQDNEPRIPSYADMSVVGIIGTAPDANLSIFPFDTPVSFFSNDIEKLAALGATGTVRQAISLINSQLGEFQVAARVVVVRVDDTPGEGQSIVSNIIGDGVSTGISAFLSSGPLNGVIPRLILVPEYSSQFFGAVSLEITGAGGTGYEDGDYTLAAMGGGGSGLVLSVSVVDGTITTAEIASPGSGYATQPTFDLSPLGAGSGGGISVTIGEDMNPIVAALPPVLEKLLAHAIISTPTSMANEFREMINSDRIIPVFNRVRVQNGVSVDVVDAAPAVAGIAVRRDFEKGGLPFWSWANQPIQGIIGVTPNTNFSLTDGATEGQALLAENIGVIIRGEMGVESAVGSSGFIFVGTDNAGDDEIWRFYNVTRGRDFIHLALLRTCRDFLGRFNITAQTIQAVLNTVGTILSDLKAEGAILGYRVSFKEDQNTPEDLRAGRFTVLFEAEEAPVLRRITFNSARYRPALDALVSQLMAQAGSVSG